MERAICRLHAPGAGFYSAKYKSSARTRDRTRYTFRCTTYCITCTVYILNFHIHILYYPNKNKLKWYRYVNNIGILLFIFTPIWNVCVHNYNSNNYYCSIRNCAHHFMLHNANVGWVRRVVIFWNKRLCNVISTDRATQHPAPTSQLGQHHKIEHEHDLSKKIDITRRSPPDKFHSQVSVKKHYLVAPTTD